MFVLQECISISVNFDGSFISRTVYSHMKTQNDNTNHLAETYLEKRIEKKRISLIAASSIIYYINGIRFNAQVFNTTCFRPHFFSPLILCSEHFFPCCRFYLQWEKTYLPWSNLIIVSKQANNSHWIGGKLAWHRYLCSISLCVCVSIQIVEKRTGGKRNKKKWGTWMAKSINRKFRQHHKYNMETLVKSLQYTHLYNYQTFHWFDHYIKILVISEFVQVFLDKVCLRFSDPNLRCWMMKKVWGRLLTREILFTLWFNQYFGSQECDQKYQVDVCKLWLPTENWLSRDKRLDFWWHNNNMYEKQRDHENCLVFWLLKNVTVFFFIIILPIYPFIWFHGQQN